MRAVICDIKNGNNDQLYEESLRVKDIVKDRYNSIIAIYESGSEYSVRMDLKR